MKSEFFQNRFLLQLIYSCYGATTKYLIWIFRSLLISYYPIFMLFPPLIHTFHWKSVNSVLGINLLWQCFNCTLTVFTLRVEHTTRNIIMKLLLMMENKSLEKEHLLIKIIPSTDLPIRGRTRIYRWGFFFIYLFFCFVLFRFVSFQVILTDFKNYNQLVIRIGISNFMYVHMKYLVMHRVIVVISSSLEYAISMGLPWLCELFLLPDALPVANREGNKLQT